MWALVGVWYADPKRGRIQGWPSSSGSHASLGSTFRPRRYRKSTQEGEREPMTGTASKWGKRKGKRKTTLFRPRICSCRPWWVWGCLSLPTCCPQPAASLSGFGVWGSCTEYISVPRGFFFKKNFKKTPVPRGASIHLQVFSCPDSGLDTFGKIELMQPRPVQSHNSLYMLLWCLLSQELICPTKAISRAGMI